MAQRPSADFVLDEQICFALYSASRAMTGAYRAELAGLGLTYTQYVVMLLLWEHDSLPMGVLCERLHLDSATLSPLLRRLADQGLVTRTRRRDDERTVEITCTAEGHRLRESVRAVQARVEEATGLSAHEVATMREDLHALAARLREYLPLDRAREA